jgi:hypothetical protein
MELSILDVLPLILLPFLLIWLGFIVCGRFKRNTSEDAPKETKATGFAVNRWLPRACGLLIVILASILPVADAIQSGIVFVSVLTHLMPAGLVLGALVLGWIRPKAGAIAFMMIVAIVLAKKGPAGSVICLPLLLCAVLFWFVKTPETGKAC